MRNKWIFFQIILAGLPFIISSIIRLWTMDDHSLFVLDYSSISFSFALLSLILLKNVSNAKNPIPNRRQNIEFKEQKDGDTFWCGVFCIVFVALFVSLEIFQISTMTNLSEKHYYHNIICIFANILAVIIFVIFSNKIKAFYNLKISL